MCLCESCVVVCVFGVNAHFLVAYLCLDVNAWANGLFGVDAHFLVAYLCLDVNAQSSGLFGTNAHS